MNSACSAQLFGEVEFGGVRRAADTVDKRPRACEVNPASRKGPNIKINESELIEGIKNGARNWAPNDLGKKKGDDQHRRSKSGRVRTAKRLRNLKK